MTAPHKTLLRASRVHPYEPLVCLRQVLEVLIETLFGSAPLSAAADEAFLSLAALAASAVDVGHTERCAAGETLEVSVRLRDS